jgi:replicative DNA helicase
MKSCESLPDGCQQRFDRIDEKLEDIHAHAVKTNGRVTKLEKTTLMLVTSLVVILATRPDGMLTILKMISSWMR